MTVFNAEEVKKCLEDVVGEDKEYALWLLEWAINKRSFDLEEYRKQIRAEALKEYMLKDCDSCEAHLREQIRAEVIDEYKIALIKAFSETNINEYGFYPQNIVDMVAIKLKEQKTNKEINVSNPISFGNQIKINKLKEQNK